MTGDKIITGLREAVEAAKCEHVWNRSENGATCAKCGTVSRYLTLTEQRALSQALRCSVRVIHSEDQP